ncbi:adhesin [Neisseria meningitidis]|nr:adhesin [Neisseria meningitidis]
MNKVFRVIWSQATQSWVAVSELTKAHKKQSSSNAQKSAVKFSGNFIKSSAIALTLLSGSAAYAADAASGLIQINSTGTATASGSESIAVGKDSKATSDTAVAIGKDAEASGKQSVALGNKAKATGENSYAIGWGSNASHPRSISIGYNSAARHNNSLALGYNTIASGPSSVALGAGSNALGDDSYAIGYGSKTNTGANFAMAFGNSSKANKANDIAFGKEAETRDQGQGHSIAIGYGAMSGTNNAGKNLNGNDAGGVAIGTGAYTGVNQTDGRSVNSSVAVGAGAGAGFRKLDNNGMPVQNATDVDNNDEVLKKAFGVKNVADYQKIAGGTNGYTNVNINEGTALGRNARAIGDQSVAIGAQTIAGMGAIALGGNDITQFANKKYYKSTKENFAVTETIDHNQDAKISDDTISGAYNRLVGTALDTQYKATYAQDGSVVLGAQAHSGTPLGTALGTNALVRKGAFGATAIGAGSQVQANAEAAVAIGMGSFADGKYAVAAGTASLAKEGDVAIGYKAKATGKEGALAIGLGTNARGDSSIMIGGADVESASKQSTTFEKAIGVNEKGGVIAKDVVEKINGKEVTRHYTFAATKTTTGTVAAAFQELTGHAMDVSSLDFSKAENKNGHASTSLGVHSLAKGNLATAIGTSARADVIGSLALGTGAHATLQNAVAIGTGSTTELLGTRQLSVNYDSDGNIVSDDSKDIAYTFKWAGGTNTSEGDVVSFGSSGAERQLKNVAAGRVAEDSTDAINGSQLNSITKKIAAGFNTSGNVVTGSSGEFTSKKANTDSADKAYETAIRSQDKVQLQVGNNLKLDRDETEVEIEVQDDFDKTKTVKKKVKKADFAYSLNPVLTNLTSAEFKADGKPTVNISSDGITITPAAPTTGGEQKPNVSLTENGLNNGGNTITNVAGNLNGAKKDTDAPKTNAAAPNTTDKNGDKYINPNNAATVGDVLNAGWNLQGNGTAKDFVTAYDIVNFIDGEGTSVSVENTDNKTSKIKYSVNLGDGLEKDATTNKIKAKAGNGVTVDADGIKVNTGKGLKIDAVDGNKVAVDTDDETITVGTDGKVKAVTGSTETVTDTNKGTDEKAGQVRPVKADKGKLATVDAVANAVNNAAWSITSDTDGGSFATSGHTKTTEKISAGGSVTFKAGDNLIIKQKGTDFTYSLNPILNGLTSAEFKGTGENAPITKLTNAGITVTTPADAVANTPEKTVTLNQDGLNNGGNAISNVKSNLPATKNSDTANTAAAPSNATKTQAVPNTTNTKGTDYVNPNNAATVGDVLNAGWNLKGKGTAVDFVKAYDTVDFVDGDGTTASVESKDGQTSTVKYSVNTTTIKPDTANAGKVKAEGTGNTFATAETVASAINDAYWKAAASGNGATTDVADNVKAGDTVTFKAGKNLTVTHNNTNKSFEFATTDTPEFSSVQFGNNGPKITNDGNTIKVSGANGTDSVKITNVADGKDDNDAVNVSQLKASGWNIAGNGKTKVDTINKDDQVNFLNGSGTTVSVTKDTDKAGKETGNVNVKYDVNVGNGLQKDTANNTISVKPADSTITVGTDGVKVNTGDIATESTGKATTALDKAIAEATKELAEATKAGDTAAQQKAQEKLNAANKAKADAGKQIATVENVTEAINKAGWNAIAAKTENGEVSGEATQLVKPGETVIFEADKNIKIAQNGSKFTFSTKDNVEFKSVKVGEEKDGKKPVSLTTEVAKPADNNQTGKAPTTALNISSGAGKDAKPTQITGVGSVLNATTVTSAPDGTAPANQPKLVNLGTAHGQTALDNNILNSAATVRDLANMGWKVSADKVTGADDKSYSDVVRNADEVKFVGTNAAKVSGKTVNGVRTITVDVEVPDVKTAKLVSSTDGSVIAPSTDSKFQDALKTAKDELAALSKDATDKQKKEAEKKVKDAETALNNALDDKGVATAKNVADMINNSGFTLKTSKAEGGNKDTASVGSEVINPGKTVEMVAGKNLTVKQDAGGKVTYSLNPELINLTSAEFKANGKPTVNISSDGIVITPNSKTSPTVSLTENGLNNGGNAITNVAGNLPSTKNNDAAATDPSNATKSQAAPTLGNTANQVNPTNAATVSDVLNAGWNLQGNGNAVDFVKPYDTVNFVNGDGTSVAVESEDGKTSTVKYSANLGDGLEKTGDNKIKVKAADKSLEVTNEGVKVKAADNTLTTDTNGLKVNTGSITTAAVPTVTAGDENKIATVGNVADAIKAAAWNATSAATTSGENTGTKVQPVKAGETVTFEADKNIKIAQADGKFTFSTKDNVEFNTVKVGAPETYKDENGQSVVKANDGKFYPASKVVNGVPNKGAQEVPADKVKAENPQVSFTRKDAKLAENNDTGKVPSTALDVSSTDGKPTQITGVGSTLNVKPVDTNPNGTATTGNARPNLIDLVGTDAKAVNKNAAATVGDLQNMGWVVSSDKATGTTGEYKDVVKNANEVRFVGEGTAVVSGKTDGNVRTITVKVNDQVSTNNAVTPVVYTKADGTKVYPVKNAQGNIEYHTTPDGKGEGDQKVDDSDVITSVNGPKGTTKPTTLSNVAGNLNGAKKDTTAPTNEAAKPDNADTIKNNAATVGDVLNAGWNLQNNGAAKDFVKPFDTVNFVNGGNTVAIVTTKADGTASDVTFNVTGLPIATTIATPNGPVQLTKVGDNYYPVKADGTPNIEKDGDGNPTNGYVKADDGKYYPASDVTFTKNPDTNVTTVTPKEGKKPVTFGNSLTNPNVVNTTDAPNNAVTAPTTLNNVKNNIPAVNDADKKVTNADGTDKPNAGDVANINKAPLTAKEAADLLKPMKDGKANPNFVGNNAATVSDVLNAGWNLQNNGAAKDFVKPYDTVNFRDGGNTTVTVTTDDNLTSHVQVNVTGLPVSNTITDPATGKQVPVVKVGDAFYRTNPDGTPNIERNDEGEPTNGYVRANDGKLYPRDAVEVTPNAADPTQPPTITPKADAKPTTVNTNLVNPNVDNTTDNPGNNVNTPNQLGNVANGAKTFNAVDADGKDYVKANNGKYYEPSKVNADGSLKDGTDATADAKNPLVLANDGKWYPADKVSDKGTPEAGATAVENPLAPKNAAGQPLVRAKDGKWYTPADVQPNGLPTPTAQPQDNAINNKAGLVDFANSNPNNAATIGDLQNMGWVVSAPGNSYSDQVRNANEVQFVGEGTAIVTGKTDDKGVRTITVKVDNQVSTNNSVTPVVYTDKNGNTVYPIKDDKGNVAYHTTPDGKGKGDTVVPNGDVNTSVNGPKDEQGNTRPASLGNVKNNIPAVNDVDKKVTNPDGTEKGTAGDVNNINKAPLTATEAADLLNPRKDGKPNPNFVGNNAATVSDVLNAGWNLQNNGTAKDFVKPYDTVNFINGLGTTAVVTTREGNTTSDVTFNVKAANGSVTVDEDGVKVTTGEMKPAVDANNKETGAIATSANPATAKQLKDALDAAVKELATAKDALKTAEKALEANPKDPALQQAVADKKAEVAAKQTPVDAAQKAHDEAGLNKVATVQNVAEAINNAGFNLTTSAATGGEKLKGAKNDGELIKPSNTVEMVAGKNLTVKQDDKGKITYATKDDVTFTNVNTGTLNVGSPNTYTDGKGNTYTKVGDNYYNPADVENGAPKPDATPVTIPADVVVKPVSPVTMKTEAAKPAKNNATDAQPSSALNITSKDGKPTQITGVGSTLNTNVVKTSPEGTPTTPGAAPKTEDAHLVDLKGTDAVPVNKNAAATVGDLQNMGWVVSTKDGNGYTDVVKNANKVDFKGGAGISVKGETTKDGVREITISVKDGEVVKPNQFTAKVNGTDTPVTKVGDQYYNTADIDPKTGNPKDNVTPVTPDKGTTPTNAGDGYVTGNKVAAAIQKSGFIVGKQTEKLSAADFNDKDEKVNPDDELRFADGNNTKVKLATKVSVDKDGNKVTTTTVKVDVTGLPVQYTDKNGTRVTKVGNQYFTVDDKGNPTATEVKPEDLTTNMVNPAAAPNVIGAPTTLGNVEGNLDGAKTGTTAPTDSHAAPNTADATKPNYVNTHNAATVGDVLNAGWNLQNNGKAKDFVKPYDTVNFVDGKGTKAVVETADNLTSTVKFDVDAGKITADTTKPGAVKGPADETLTKALKDAKDALAKLPKDADAATVKAAQDKVDAAQKAIDDSPNSNKVATAQNVADMINNSGFTLKADKTKGDNSTAADLANGEMIHPGDTITMKAGKNMSVKHEKNGSITYETKDDVNFNSLSLGDSKHAPTLSADEDGSLRLGSKNNQAPVRISNVAPGIKDGDAVNVSQLKGVTKDLEDKIDGVAAGSNAAASLPQVYLPGKSMVAASVGTYGSQGALAVGYSSISDNGKWLIKGQINVNTKAKTGGGVGVGYLW